MYSHGGSDHGKSLGPNIAAANKHRKIAGFENGDNPLFINSPRWTITILALEVLYQY
jgi:hypothetical protein